MQQAGAAEERLHGWIARAAFPEERLHCPAFTAAAEQNQAVVEDRCASWDAIFAGDDAGDDAGAHADASAKLSALKVDLLRARGVSDAEWRAGMRDVVVCAPGELPAWAATFIALYSSWRAEPALAATADAPAGKPYLLLTAVWASQRRAWVEAMRAELQTAGIILTDAAVDDVLEYLTLRLATPVFSVLNSWPGAWRGASTGDDGGDDRWQFLRALAFWESAFDRQPILVHIIGHLTQLWQTATAEMLARFKDDLPRLRDAELLRAGDGAVTVLRLRCGLGDPHRGGRSVAIFETDCGDAVYKPKDLAGTRATGQLLHELHGAHAEFVPLAPAFLYRRGYGWERRVCARACESKAQVETFYRRLGGWLFLLQLFGGNDFWYDNLIACADMPFFIDYETVVGNSVTAPFASRRGGQVGEQLEMFYQLQLIGILPLLMPGAVDGALTDGIDISVTTRPGKQSIPFPKTDGGGFYNDFEASDYAPFYRGEFQDINDYFAHFVDGYRRMADAIESPAGRAALQRFRRRIKRARFRHIVIDTWSCYALLGSLFSNCRTDGARAAIALDAVCARYKNYPRCIIDGVRRDAWRNDVPLFEMQADGLRLFNTAGAATEEDFFVDAALAKITRNRRYLRANLESQVARIEAVFSTRPDNPRRPWPRPADADGDAPAPTLMSRDECLALALETGAQLASNLNRVDNLRDYLAIGRAQRNNIRAVQPLPADYHGAAGALVFLAQLRHDVGSNLDARDATDDIDLALARCGRYLASAPRITAFAERGLACGGVLSAFGGQLLALSRLARAEVEAGFDVAATVERMLNAHIDDLNAAQGLCADERHGVCGLLARMPDLAALFPADTVAAWLKRILNIIESKPLQFSPPQTDSYKRYADAFYPAHGMQLVERMMQSHWRAFTAHAGYRKLQRFIAEHAPPPAPADDARESLRDMPSEALLDRAYRRIAGSVHGHGDALAELVARRRAAGRWLPDQWAGDDFLPGGVYGLADIGLLLLSAARRANLNPYRMPRADSTD